MPPINPGMSDGSITCVTCNSDISKNPHFYTIARNANMFGFFCCEDCAQMSEINRFLKAYVVRITATPESHRKLVVTPDVNTLKKYQQETEKRKLWKKYLD